MSSSASSSSCSSEDGDEVALPEPDVRADPAPATRTSCCEQIQLPSEQPASLGAALEARRIARDAEIKALEERIAGLRAEQAADDELQRQWPRLTTAPAGPADGKCCAAHESHWGEGKCSVPSSGCAQGEGSGVDCDCDCDCHAIASAGREAVLAKLGQGVDFSPLFSEKEEDFEKEDMDPEQEQILGAFERTLARAHGWCAVAKAPVAGARGVPRDEQAVQRSS